LFVWKKYSFRLLQGSVSDAVFREAELTLLLLFWKRRKLMNNKINFELVSVKRNEGFLFSRKDENMYRTRFGKNFQNDCLLEGLRFDQVLQL
jgi:hypothetical protein